jgi:hypothetical protein
VITNTVLPCIFPQLDDDEPGRRTWVRVEPSNWGITIAIFKEQPTPETPEWQAMSVVHVDACFMNQVKVQLWDEYQDSERDDGRWITLVADVDGWRPREDEVAGSRVLNKGTILVQVTEAQQLGLELEMHTLFGLQVDDARPTSQPGEVWLIYEVEAESPEQFARIVALLEGRKAAGAIVDVAVSASGEDEWNSPVQPDPVELMRRALAALSYLQREWLVRALGDHLDVIADALQEYMDRRKVRPRTAPFSQASLRASVRRGEYVSGIVAVDLGDIIDRDLEGLLDELSMLLTGSELLMDITYTVVGHEGQTLWLEVTGDATEVVGCMGEDEQEGALLFYRAELVVFTEEEARAIVGASALDPWSDQGANESAGHGFVLAVRDTEQLGEDVVLPAAVTGSRRRGLWIDGPLTGALSQFQAILGQGRTWRTWPDSDLALVVPDAAYADPLDDPLLAQLAQALALTEIHTLEDLGLAEVYLYEGYLIVRNERGQLETWEMLPDGRGLDLDLTERSPVLNYQGDLYSYGNTYASREESEQAIRKERGK